MEDDLAVSKTEGFKVGEKKTIDEYQKLGTSTSEHTRLGERSLSHNNIMYAMHIWHLVGTNARRYSLPFTSYCLKVLLLLLSSDISSVPHCLLMSVKYLTMLLQTRTTRLSTGGKLLLASVPALPSPTQTTPGNVSSNPSPW